MDLALTGRFGVDRIEKVSMSAIRRYLAMGKAEQKEWASFVRMLEKEIKRRSR